METVFNKSMNEVSGIYVSWLYSNRYSATFYADSNAALNREGKPISVKKYGGPTLDRCTSRWHRSGQRRYMKLPMIYALPHNPHFDCNWKRSCGKWNVELRRGHSSLSCRRPHGPNATHFGIKSIWSQGQEKETCFGKQRWCFPCWPTKFQDSWDAPSLR